MTAFTILTVCSGNICRSPLAEQLLRVGLAPWPEVTIASAGTVGLVDSPMPEQAAELSRRFGGDPSAHAGRLLETPQVDEAGLILGMARKHRKAAVQLLPQANRRTFTLREFARLARGVSETDLDALADIPLSDTAARFAAAVELAAMRRGMEMPDSPDDDDVIDPYRQGQEVYEESAQQLVPAVETVLNFLRTAATKTAV